MNVNVTNNEGYTFRLMKDSIEVFDYMGLSKGKCSIDERVSKAFLELAQTAQDRRTHQIQFYRKEGKPVVVIGQYGLAGGGLGNVWTILSGLGQLIGGMAALPANPIAGSVFIWSGINWVYYGATTDSISTTDLCKHAAKTAASGIAFAYAGPLAGDLVTSAGPLAVAMVAGGAGNASAKIAGKAAEAVIEQDLSVFDNITVTEISEDVIAGTIAGGMAEFSVSLINQSKLMQNVISGSDFTATNTGVKRAVFQLSQNEISALNFIQVHYEIPNRYQVQRNRLHLYLHEGEIHYKTIDPLGILRTIIVSDQYQAYLMPADGNSLFHAISHQLMWRGLPEYNTEQLRAKGENIRDLCQILNVKIQVFQKVENNFHSQIYGEAGNTTLFIYLHEGRYCSFVSHVNPGDAAKLEVFRNVIRNRGEFTQEQKEWIIFIASKYNHKPVRLDEGVVDAACLGVVKETLLHNRGKNVTDSNSALHTTIPNGNSIEKHHRQGRTGISHGGVQTLTAPPVEESILLGRFGSI